MSQTVTRPSRRSELRIEQPDGVWAIWLCNHCEMVSAVRNISPTGLFLETVGSRPFGATAEVSLLVPEGEITADAVVRHAQPGRGIGLKFTRMRETDRSRMVSLMKRLRDAHAKSASDLRADRRFAD